MPVGGALILKGTSTPLGAINKKKKKKKKAKPVELDFDEAPDVEQTAEGGAPSSTALRTVTTTSGSVAKPGAVSILTGKNYEEEFATEIEKGRTGQVKNTPWGSSYAKTPKILHGYDREVKGVTAEERLDIRVAQRSDKFCR